MEVSSSFLLGLTFSRGYGVQIGFVLKTAVRILSERPKYEHGNSAKSQSRVKRTTNGAAILARYLFQER
jgi:hypothetical protein